MPFHRIHKFARFVLSNSLGTLVDNLVLWTFSHFVFHEYMGQYILSPFISFECAVLSNYLCSWHFIWSDRTKQYIKPRFWRRYIFYNLSATGTFLVKMGFLLLLERIFGWHVVVCNLSALCISGILNFVMSECVIFKKVETPPKQHPLL